MSQGTSNNFHALFCPFILCCSKSLTVEPLFQTFPRSCVAFCLARKLNLAMQWCAMRHWSHHKKCHSNVSTNISHAGSARLLKHLADQAETKRNLSSTNRQCQRFGSLQEFNGLSLGWLTNQQNQFVFDSRRVEGNSKSACLHIGSGWRGPRPSSNVCSLTKDTNNICTESFLKAAALQQATRHQFVDGQWHSQGSEERPSTAPTWPKKSVSKWGESKRFIPTMLLAACNSLQRASSVLCSAWSKAEAESLYDLFSFAKPSPRTGSGVANK